MKLSKEEREMVADAFERILNEYEGGNKNHSLCAPVPINLTFKRFAHTKEVILDMIVPKPCLVLATGPIHNKYQSHETIEWPDKGLK